MVVVRARTRGLLAVTAALGYGALYRAGRRAGSTAAERAARLPGDDVVLRPTMVTDHAVTVGATPLQVWPWLAQLGWRLGGYYTPRWVDRLVFPANWPSLDRLDPLLVRDLAPGDVIPDGAPGTAWYVVAEVVRPHALVLHSTTHVPPGWRRHGAMIDWTWAFRLTALPGGRTRLHLRMRGRTAPWWLTVGYHAALVPADFVMATGMLRGVRRRIEAAPAPAPSGRQPFDARVDVLGG
ncbi:hypothetical protein [Krasilnikovia sp. MM14-A1259]|uniref:hypothetical protein n=1 Tax=Krasilnikovia sp. MM14-A1259 TaxID=3373539 RepID=UPI00399CD9E6